MKYTYTFLFSFPPSPLDGKVARERVVERERAGERGSELRRNTCVRELEPSTLRSSWLGAARESIQVWAALVLERI